ncbi:DNA (cytosine-5)-methyltransferase 1 [Nowakowskiella sp. JEL0407]|nr:DNA (cytosine-5)-methyltransferase 1 [Nowakowskiella sp. JEL0407]
MTEQEPSLPNDDDLFNTFTIKLMEFLIIHQSTCPVAFRMEIASTLRNISMYAFTQNLEYCQYLQIVQIRIMGFSTQYSNSKLKKIWFIPFGFDDSDRSLSFRMMNPNPVYADYWRETVDLFERNPPESSSKQETVSDNDISMSDEDDDSDSDSDEFESAPRKFRKLDKGRKRKLSSVLEEGDAQKNIQRCIESMEIGSATHREFYNLFAEDILPYTAKEPEKIGFTSPYSVPNDSTFDLPHAVEEDLESTFLPPTVTEGEKTYFTGIKFGDEIYKIGDFAFAPFDAQAKSFQSSQGKLGLMRILEISNQNNSQTEAKVQIHCVWYYFGRDTILKKDFFQCVSKNGTLVESEANAWVQLPVVFATDHHQSIEFNTDLPLQKASVLHYRLPSPVPECCTGDFFDFMMDENATVPLNSVICLQFYNLNKSFISLHARDATHCFDHQVELPLSKNPVISNVLESVKRTCGESVSVNVIPTLRGVLCSGEYDNQNGTVEMCCNLHAAEKHVRILFGRGDELVEGIIVAVPEFRQTLFSIYKIDCINQDSRAEDSDIICSGIRMWRKSELEKAKQIEVEERMHFTQLIHGEEEDRRNFTLMGVSSWEGTVKVFSTIPRMNGSCNEFYCNSHVDGGFIRKYEQNPFPAEPEPTNLSQNYLKYIPGRSSPFRALSLYSGIDCLGFGLAESGFLDVKWGVELRKEHAETFEYNYPDAVMFNMPVVKVLDSIKQGFWPKVKDQPPKPFFSHDVEVIIAGPPCQGHSLANRRAKDLKAKEKVAEIIVFLEMVELIRPKYVMMENVPNLATGRGRDKESNVYYRAKSVLLQLGYQFTSPMLNAGMHGVPQRRERLFLIASYCGFPAPCYPEATHFVIEKRTPNNLDLPSGEKAPGSEMPEKAYFKPLKSGDFIGCPEFPEATIRERLDYSADDHTYDNAITKIRKGAEMLDFRMPVETLLTVNAVVHPNKIRYLTLHEYKILQGIPRSVSVRSEHNGRMSSFSSGYQAVGNSVPPPLAKAIGNALVRACNRWYLFNFGTYADGLVDNSFRNSEIILKRCRQLKHGQFGWGQFNGKEVALRKNLEERLVFRCWEGKTSVRKLEKYIKKIWDKDCQAADLKKMVIQIQETDPENEDEI